MQVKNLLGLVSLPAVLAFVALAQAVTPEQIRERIAPVGSVCMAGDDCASDATASAADDESGRSGEQIYQNHCSTCHASGVAGAPKTGSVDDWAYRLEQGMDVVYANAKEGLNGMPAMGLCMDCSDEELEASVDFMVEQSR